MSRTKWILTLIGVIVVAIILWRVFAGSGGKHGIGRSGADKPVPVTVVPTKAEDVPLYLTSQGTVQPINIVNVQSQVGGQLLKLGFVEGKPVKKGQVLAEIDPRSLQAQLNQAIAKRNQDATQLATAQAKLERSENPKYRQYVPQIDRITQKNTVAQWKAAVAADDASIQNTKVKLGFTKVNSPINGIAGLRQVSPGNIITTGTIIVTITQMHPIDVIFSLAGKYLDQVRTAQAKAPLNVAVLDANGNAIEADGVLKVINNQIDPNTGSFKMKAEFPNDHNQLYPGEYANVRLKVGVDSNALVVPIAAVQRGPNGEYVWLVTDQPPKPAPQSSSKPAGHGKTAQNAHAGKTAGKPAQYVTMQPVTVDGQAGDSGLIISKGLKAGDLVVTAGQFRLKQGTKVTPLKPGEVPAPAATAAKPKASGQSGG